MNARRRAGLSQTALAGKLRGVKKRAATVSAWETGNAIPKGEVMLQLPKALGVSGHWLLTGEGDSEPTPTGRLWEWMREAPTILRRLDLLAEEWIITANVARAHGEDGHELLESCAEELREILMGCGDGRPLDLSLPPPEYEAESPTESPEATVEGEGLLADAEREDEDDRDAV